MFIHTDNLHTVIVSEVLHRKQIYTGRYVDAELRENILNFKLKVSHVKSKFHFASNINYSKLNVSF